MSENKIPKTPLKFIWFITLPHKWWAVSSSLTMAIGSVLGLFGYYLISRLIDDFTTAPDKASQIDTLIFWGTAFFILTLVERALWRLSGFLGIKWLVEMHATGYRVLYDYLLKHSHNYFSNRFAGSLSNKVSNAVDGGTRLVERLLWGAGPEIISLFATVFLFWVVHWSVAVILVFTIIFVFILNVWFVQKRKKYVVAYSKASSRVRGEGVDLISNISAVRQYSKREEELQRLDQSIEDRAHKDKRQWFMGEWLMVINTIIGLVLTAVILLVVYQMLVMDMTTVGSLVLVLTLLGRVGFVFATLGNMLNGFVRMYGETEEGLEDVLVEYDIEDGLEAVPLAVKTGSMKWSNVTFEYGENKVFDEFDLTIPAGQRVGLVGPSGAGKTTFVSLLLRQHDLSSGEILIDGQNIAEVTQDSLRENIAVVPQEPLLFHRTIRENIAYGKPDATDNEIMAVARLAKAHEFIKDLAQGYDTLVGERGIKLSGGQKQRVAIARAMLKDAPILVLDEATSALDSESEVVIQQALHKLMEGKTVIAIAHRLSTLREMDRIIVLEGGKIVEDGSHDSLLKYGGVYSRLWDHQAGGFLQE